MKDVATVAQGVLRNGLSPHFSCRQVAHSVNPTLSQNINPPYFVRGRYMIFLMRKEEVMRDEKREDNKKREMIRKEKRK